MSSDDPIQDLIHSTERRLDELGYPAPRRLAQDIRVRIVYGQTPGGTKGPPSIITLPYGLSREEERQKLAHELGHIFIQRSGVDKELRAQWSFTGPETFRMHNETLAAHLGGRILLPTPLRLKAERRYGVSAQAAIALQKVTQLELPQVLDRMIHIDPDASRGAFITAGKTLILLETNNVWIEKSLYARVAEVDQLMPGARLSSLRDDRVLGVGGW
ncbi:hypothetical protein GCM10022631_02080 [Deinococcus rubellus]|uniref:ImmA/IrrE family metallo-endopeptidase n=1 Tax=Deinococcus rubellus TaxID=1889240 RepID=A0ABY5YKX6_9DEIO|nr:ImmA/IrrE family metallo-endopeptidase [Deinococcus rubellus]UWX64791.1 ImmA/IrrE family metallo-endopeptidase [Deinococcus rubellus]